MDTEVEVVVRSIYLASSLYCQGIRLLTITHEKNRNANFIFQNENGEASEAIRDYFSGDRTFRAKELFEALSMLKIESVRAQKNGAM